MKKLLMLTFLASVTLFSASAQATIDWAGNAFPNNGHVTTPTGDQFVVAEVFKAGVTDGVGQGLDLSAVIQYQTDLMGATATVAMNYNVDKGSNDEYLGFIPQAALTGAAWVDVTVIFTDAVDASVFEITGDQAGNAPLLRYTVSNVLPNDVAVTFTVCMSGTVTTGAPCVIGGAAPIGNWGTGVTMTNVSGDLWNVTVTFPAGSSPSFDYKYKKDACATWEGTANRTVVLPTDGTTSLVLATDSWEFTAIGCGLGTVLDADRTISFQVCLTGIANTGGVCVIGNIPELTTWSTGVPLVNTSGALWGGSITIPAGTPIPVNVEYKFKKDGCATWESVPNRIVTIDNTSPASQGFAHPWDEGLSDCFPVAIEIENFGTVKSRF